MLHIQATNLELTAALRDYVEKKLIGLEKFVTSGKSIDLCAVEVAKTSRHHKKGEIYRAEVTLTTAGKKFYAYSEQTDLYKAIDDVKDEIVRELTSNKGRAMRLIRHGARQIKFILKGLL